ncbi:cupin domain-containing protein [Ochrobactrum soli]|uniref:Transcriptional regulator, AraC family n=1 Tax=Ochrobactrum soli TaxID=2448455 RepID=A0A2P9HEP8_9HYPH|nr:cupin domain-containing protein [[Ochrobactrum] soli]SPL62549.1 Transcriptional regulator, AraC family [[Ochrobactrum] soli]
MIYARKAMFISRSAETMSDPFSSVSSALSVRDIRATGLNASGNWALSFDARARLKVVAVILGQCWLIVPAMTPLALPQGDVALGQRYTVASDPAVEPADGIALYAPPGGYLVQFGQGDEVSIVGRGRVGQPPLDHLTTWRMILAQRMLGAGERVAVVRPGVQKNFGPYTPVHEVIGRPPPTTPNLRTASIYRVAE